MHQGQCRRKCCKNRHLKVSRPGLRRAVGGCRLGLKHPLAPQNGLLEICESLR